MRNHRHVRVFSQNYSIEPKGWVILPKVLRFKSNLLFDHKYFTKCKTSKYFNLCANHSSTGVRILSFVFPILDPCSGSIQNSNHIKYKPW